MKQGLDQLIPKTDAEAQSEELNIKLTMTGETAIKSRKTTEDCRVTSSAGEDGAHTTEMPHCLIIHGHAI